MKMKKRAIWVSAVATVLTQLSSVLAYEIELHRDMTLEAVQRSRFMEALERLAIDPLTPLAIDDRVFTNRNDGYPVDWIVAGSHLEDTDPGREWARCPTRPRHHFHDPVRDRGLVRFGVSAGESSVDWALEDRHELPDQDYSIRDATNAYWDALRGELPEDRERSFARLFRSLGHAVHLVQDSAQPQHTRNDAHAGWCFPVFGGSASAYERYTDEAAFRARAPLGGYPAVALSEARHYWDSGSGLGLAELSNRSFVSSGTNFGGFCEPPECVGLEPHSSYADPGADASAVPWDVGDLFAEAGQSTDLEGVVYLIDTPWADHYTGSSARNPRTSTFSLFDADLDDRGLFAIPPRFTLNRFNYEAAATILIPRAVGYSAGLLNHFFRAEIGLSQDWERRQGRLIENLGDEPLSGTFAVYYDAEDGSRHPVPDASWTLGLAPGQVERVEFSDPSDPMPETPGRYIIAFRGAHGAESEEVAGAVVEIGPRGPFCLDGFSDTFTLEEETYSCWQLPSGSRPDGSCASFALHEENPHDLLIEVANSHGLTECQATSARRCFAIPEGFDPDTEVVSRHRGEIGWADYSATIREDHVDAGVVQWRFSALDENHQTLGGSIYTLFASDGLADAPLSFDRFDPVPEGTRWFETASRVYLQFDAFHGEGRFVIDEACVGAAVDLEDPAEEPIF